jgi:hypothetical protein
MTLTVQPDPLDELAAAARAALGCGGTPGVRAFRAVATPEHVLALAGAIADLRRLIALETHPDGHDAVISAAAIGRVLDDALRPLTAAPGPPTAA